MVCSKKNYIPVVLWLTIRIIDCNITLMYWQYIIAYCQRRFISYTLEIFGILVSKFWEMNYKLNYKYCILMHLRSNTLSYGFKTGIQILYIPLYFSTKYSYKLYNTVYRYLNSFRHSALYVIAINSWWTKSKSSETLRYLIRADWTNNALL